MVLSRCLLRPPLWLQPPCLLAVSGGWLRCLLALSVPFGLLAWLVCAPLWLRSHWSEWGVLSVAKGGVRCAPSRTFSAGLCCLAPAKAVHVDGWNGVLLLPSYRSFWLLSFASNGLFIAFLWWPYGLSGLPFLRVPMTVLVAFRSSCLA